jgi:class 3 adenylate cyclase
LADRDNNLHKAYEKDGGVDSIKLNVVDANNKASNDLSNSVKIQYASASLGAKIESCKDIQRWDYDVFLHTNDELIMLYCDIFEDRGLFTRFSIDIKVFIEFTRNVIAGYVDTAPYHNSYHGFDVMHVTYLFISTCQADGYLEDFNILSLVVAAIAHDVGHDGFNNAFHATTMSELAITYNSISIMENFSAAFLFRILSKPSANILARIPEADCKKLRGRLIDMILDTDAKNHFILMTRFKHGLEMKQLSRGLLSSMLLHIADVSNPTRPGKVCRQWAFNVQEEFFRQGDKEKELGLPLSPFMDREYENLPRMQGAFTDALVSPVFHLVSEFLPKITDNCIKSMQVNRAFWNNLQTKQILTTPKIKEYLEQQDANNNNADNSNNDTPEILGSPTQNPQYGVSIPGIPQNAPQSPGSAKRKMSLIAMRSAIEEDANSVASGRESGDRDNDVANDVLSPRAVDAKKKADRELRKLKTAHMLDGNWVQLFMLVCTAYALVADDLSLWIGSRENDSFLSIITFVVLLAFTLELFVSVYCVPEYMQFFFWLDFVAALSLIPEIDFLMGDTSTAGSEIEDQATLTRAGRAAKAGARAGRLARVLRLIRLVRIIKLIKWVGNYVRRQVKSQQAEELETEEEVEMKMSNVGRTMTESITRKVILAVMFMLLTFSIFDAVPVPDARLEQLKIISNYKNDSSGIGLELANAYWERYQPDCFVLSGIGDTLTHDVVASEDAEGTMAYTHSYLRTIEQEVIYVKGDSAVYAIFDISGETQNTAMQSFIMTIVVTILLAVLSMLFSRDAYNIMIRPIEKMKHTVQQLSENPLLHLKKLEDAGPQASNGESETDMLEQAITKMARLLQIGFGSAGAEIIAKNLSEGGELNPMIPGSKIEGIFGFCDIREFTFATEGLQQDVMLFVNKVAEITHKHVVDSGGAPNKNIGDAFLLVWKLADEAGGGKSNLQKELYDAALVSFQKIIRDIKRMSNLAAFLEGAAEDAAWRASLADFKVNMGFGLHTGWAIEGSIGSKVKVDASYLSPHVNLASRLEAATKQFGVPLLMSEAFTKGLSGTTQSSCRRVDAVTFKGSSEPMHIFHYDSEPFDSLKKGSVASEDLLAKCTWTNEDAKAASVDVAEIKNLLDSKKEHTVRQVYEMGFLSYVDGQWDKSKIMLAIWVERFPADPLGLFLLEMLHSEQFKAPAAWPGYHALTEK